jgi:outer membrane protein
MSRAHRRPAAPRALGLALLAAIMLLPGPLTPQEDATPAALPDVPADQPLTLDQAIRIGIARHPSLSIARLDVTAARGSTVQAESERLPSVTFGSDYSRSMSTGSAVVGGVTVPGTTSRYSTQYAASLRVQQLLFDFGRANDQMRQSRFQEEAARYEFAQTEDDVIDNVRQAFLVLLANKEFLEVARFRVRLQEGTVEMARAQEEEGFAPRADVVKAESALAAAQLDVTSAENAVALSRVALSEAMGIDVRTDYEVVGPPEPEPVELTQDELLTGAMDGRPEVLAARARADAADAGLKAAAKAHKPSLSASGSYGWREYNFPPSLDYWNLGVSLDLNVFDGWLSEGRKKQARAQRDAARDTIYLTEQRVAQEVVQAFLDLRAAEEQIVSAQASIASADEDLRLAQGRYAENVGILLEVLDAQTALTAAQADLVQARFLRASARYALERAIGASLTELTGEEATE